MKNYPDNTVKDLVGVSCVIIPVTVEFDESEDRLRISLLTDASMLIKVENFSFYGQIEYIYIYSNSRCRWT